MHFLETCLFGGELVGREVWGLPEETIKGFFVGLGIGPCLSASNHKAKKAHGRGRYGRVWAVARRPAGVGRGRVGRVQRSNRNLGNEGNEMTWANLFQHLNISG